MLSFFRSVTLLLKVEHDEDEWEYSEEPHVARRQLILQRHPEIKRLMGPDPRIALFVAAEVAFQATMMLLVAWLDPGWPLLIFISYVVSGTINHSLGSAIHEIGHNLAFGHKHNSANRILSIFANLPMGVPMAISYKKYHQDHHRWLGHDTRDVDIPTVLEVLLFRHALTKLLWLFIFPIMHALRPFLKSPKPVTQWELVNLAVQLAIDLVVLRVLGVKSLAYMIAGTLLGLGVHPLSGHFISEHFLFTDHQATHSYYGSGNWLMYNLGYHVEHHDFPYIPCTRIHKVREMAPEFYVHLPYHTSWCRVLWDFLWQEHLGPHAHMVSSEDISNPGIYSHIAVVPESVPVFDNGGPDNKVNGAALVGRNSLINGPRASPGCHEDKKVK